MLKNLFTYLVVISGIALLLVGCGGDNPTVPKDSKPTKLEVDINLSKEEVSPGDEIEITAEINNPQKYERIKYTWINVTEYGTLSATNLNSVTWSAPENFDIHEVRVEVIKLIVTATFGKLTVTNDRVKTDTKILTANSNVTIKIVSQS